MRTRIWLVAATLAGVVVLQAEVPQPPVRSGQTFRTGTDVVMVDVSVRDRGKAVTGLTAADFVLTDNGVRQQIDSVEATAVPIDLTIVVDVSGNPRTAWTTPMTAAALGQTVRSEVAPIASLLRPTDRMRLLASDTYVQHVVPMGSVGPLPPLRVDGGGLSSLFDTLIAALLQPVEPARRHVVVARTKGLDTISSVEAAAVRAVAERSDALFHVVVMETAFDNEAALAGFQCAKMGLCWPNRTLWVPHRSQLVGPRPYHQVLRDGQVIAAGAEATGGALHQAQLLTEPTLGGTFKKAFEDFRSSYVLRYTLKGVPSGGWHAIEVTMPRARGYTVKARKGYLVEASATPKSAPALPSPLRSVADFTAAYEQGAYRQVATDVRRLRDPTDLLRDFMDAGNPWPGKPRREASLILELVEPLFFSARSETREVAFKTIDRYRQLIRHPLEADIFERYWYFALLSMLEGGMRPSQADWYVYQALQRFPDEPRFLLSSAIITEQKTAVVEAGTLSNAMIEEVKQKYEAAVAFPTTAVEARIRLAAFLQHTKRPQEALIQLSAAGTQTIEEPALRYLHQLILGHVLWSVNRRDESLAAYRAALAILPNAQSARVALMNALLLQGDRAGAEALAVQVQTEATEAPDPWWAYWQGQYRLHPYVMARLREMSQ
jgi:VWFA-related protein